MKIHRPTPLTRDLALIGGGHAHALALKRLGMRPVAGARVTLISDAPTAPYSGMLPGAVAGVYPRQAITIDLVKLARAAGARLILAEAVGLDLAERRILLKGRAALPFDVASLNIGATTSAHGLDDPFGRVTPVKPTLRFLDAWEAYAREAAAGRAAAAPAVVGAGVGGVELACAMAVRLRRAGGLAPFLFCRDALPGKGLPPTARRRLADRLAAAGVRLVANADAVGVDDAHILLADGRRFEAGFIAAATGVRPARWLAEAGLALDAAGFVLVDDALRAVGQPALFAAGDVASLASGAREKAGVYAVRQAPWLAENLSRALRGLPPSAIRLQKRHLKLILTGEARAAAERNGLLIGGGGGLGRLLWLWKDWIDRRFMASLDPPPEDGVAAAPRDAAAGVAEAMAAAPTCAACGSKLGAGVLAEALSRRGAGAAPFVLRGVGADAALIGAPEAAFAVSVDHFRAFSDDAELVGRVATLHAFGDVLATGAQPTAALIAATLPAMSERLAARSLGQLMDGVEAALGALGATLIGGHSAEGADFSVGVTAIGATDAAHALGLEGARPGDALWLTRALGSGAILAAEMRRRAAGDDVAALYQTLATPQAAAARALQAAGARAMTDVTGFGLIGHLATLCRASTVSARIDRGALRFFAGAERAAAAGVESSLAPKNRAAFAPLCDGLRDTPGDRLLFDPQTAGGFLAALPAGATPRGAWRIGAVEDGPPRLRVG